MVFAFVHQVEMEKMQFSANERFKNISISQLHNYLKRVSRERVSQRVQATDRLEEIRTMQTQTQSNAASQAPPLL